jgi:geranylgeranyl diphosphate synthase type II
VDEDKQPPSDLVPSLLREYGDAVRVALCDYLRPQEPLRNLYSLVADYPQRGGRMLRPSLCIAAARAFGASIDDAVHSAAAIELLHNAFLVHDDIEDESDERRGRPTLHVLHGVPMAVNVGDALTLLGLRALIDNRRTMGLRLTMWLLEDALRMAQETVEGQAMELGWRRDNANYLESADYLEMTLKKTCRYTTIFPLRAGALTGTRKALEPDRFVRLGFFLGAAFQIQDDLLNLLGDPEQYGKELGGDLLEGKRTLMLIHLLRSAGSEERTRLDKVLALPRAERADADARWMRERMDAHGSIHFAREVAHALAGAARHEFTREFAAVPDSRDKRFVGALTRWVLERA